ncbi:MAG: hypothetical protein IJ349_03945 [Clostridia bacterium]|nr:hypothetical protein [Clostridia bacterium]
MKKISKDTALLTVLGVVAALLLVFCINAAKSDISDAVVTAQPSSTVQTVTTTAPVTTTVASPATKAPVQTTKPAAVQTTAPAPVDETEEIIRVMTDAIMGLKSDDANFRGHKVQNIDIRLVDSSIPSMNDFVNSIINVFVKEEIYDYDFTDGVSAQPEGGGTTTSDSMFPPGDCNFRITADGVAKATKEKDGENTVYTIVIVPETSTLENPRPPHHNAAADTLDLSGVEIPIATITKVDFEYPGATVSVTLNPEGEVVGYYEHLPVKGTGEAKALGLTGYGTIEGYMEEKWDIEWK